MDWQDRISVDPKVLVGKPVIKGTRIAVEFLMELLASACRKIRLARIFPATFGKNLREDGNLSQPGV
ncbi:MAG TPA: DUF433 domain-containing protein [Pirellulales bacterium]|nr:DUF433 domain-containing protein [Pirellulales bacterium]